MAMTHLKITGDNMAHALCMLGVRHTLRICNTHCLSMATMVTWTCLSVTLYGNGLFCLIDSYARQCSILHSFCPMWWFAGILVTMLNEDILKLVLLFQCLRGPKLTSRPRYKLRLFVVFLSSIRNWPVQYHELGHILSSSSFSAKPIFWCYTIKLFKMSLIFPSGEEKVPCRLCGMGRPCGSGEPHYIQNTKM